MLQLMVIALVIGTIWWVVKRVQRMNWDAWRPVGRHYLADARAVLRKPVQQPPAKALYDVYLNELRPLTDAEWDAFMEELDDE